MKTCTRCNGRLDTAAKAAHSEVCTACGYASGEVEVVPVMALTPFRTQEDWIWIIDRYLNNGDWAPKEPLPPVVLHARATGADGVVYVRCEGLAT